MSDHAFAGFFSRWRQVSLGGRVVVEGCVDASHARPSAELTRALGRWPGHHYWQQRGDDRWLVLVHEEAATRERWWLHALLLLATLVSASYAAASWTTALPGPALADMVLRGLPFGGPLLAVLAAHETAHFAVARRYRIDASPPYFLPVYPPAANAIGALGAVVRLRSPVFDRRTLFDVSVAGPLAGLAVAVPTLAVGLLWSHATADAALPLAHQFVDVGGRALFLGDSPLLLGLRAVAGEAGVVRLHPTAVAGWVGVFVTMLHLLPLAQFDGGHIGFCVLGRRQQWVSWATVVGLAALAVLCWQGWWAWAALALVTGGGRLAHPRLVSAATPLDARRRWAALLAAVVLALCVSPVPARWG